MFGQAVVRGFLVLSFWETYVAILMYFAIAFIPMMAGAVLAGGVGRAQEKRVGCIRAFFVATAQSIAMTVFVLTLLPILLGTSPDATWGQPWWMLAKSPHVFLQIGWRLWIVAFAISFIPVVGELTSFTNLIVGGAALPVAMKQLAAGLDSYAILGGVNPLPDTTMIIGFVLLAGVATVLGRIIHLGTTSATGRTSEDFRGTMATLVQTVIGLLPVFMYGAWLGMQMTAR